MPSDLTSSLALETQLSPAAPLPLGWSPELQLIYDSAPIGLAFISLDCRYLQINQRLTEICGISVADHLGRTVRQTVPALADAVEQIVASIARTGEPVIGVEVAGQRPDETGERYWSTYWHPLRGPDGEIAGINVAAEEITQRKRAEAEVHASELRFHTLADAIPQLVWMADASGKIFWFNRKWEEHIEPSAQSSDWTTALHPGVKQDTMERWRDCVRAGVVFEMELPLRGSGGQFRPFLTQIVPLRDPAGVIYRWIGTHTDISEQNRREEHIRVILNELSHRTKNLLTVIMAVSSQTARRAATVADYQKSFSERLLALSHSHDLLVRNDWHGVSFGDLVTVQMRPFRGAGEHVIQAKGPAIKLQSDHVQNLGLALHELATNASKHGALSVPQGEVALHWHMSPAEDRLHVRWFESGGPAVTPPSRHGFGQMLIEQLVPKALNGTGALSFASTGVSWTFECPIAPRGRHTR